LLEQSAKLDQGAAVGADERHLPFADDQPRRFDLAVTPSAAAEIENTGRRIVGP
jgi:hypothetical protein